MPVSATFMISTKDLAVTFSEPLAPGPLAPGNIKVDADLGAGLIHFTGPGAGSVLGPVATWPFFRPGGVPVASGVYYTKLAPPFVTSLASGVEAEPFAAFPVAVIP